MTRAIPVVVVVLLLLPPIPTVLAQAPREARLIVTVVDPSGAVIPDATVRVIGLDGATKKLPIAPMQTSAKGMATFERLQPGRYSISGEFPGFELGLLRDQQVKRGDNKHVLVLPLQKLTAEITVSRDRQMVASDRGLTFGTTLTREAIEALSDDPQEMERQLMEMAGPGAAIRVDSFEGQQLPPKAQIKSIHVTRDMFAAENHSAGGVFIDIITQPGIGPIRATARYVFYDSAMDGENPLVPKKGPAQSQVFNGTVGGSIVKERSSFSVSFYGVNSYKTPDLYAATPAGTVARNVNLRQPSDEIYVNGLFDYALTKDQTLRITYNRYSVSNGNQGVGTYDLIGRAYSTESANNTLRVQEAGPIGRRFFTNTRFALRWNDSDTHSELEVPTIVVNDSFTSGGAQRAGGRHVRTFLLQSDLDYVRGINSWRAGIQLDGGQYRSDDATNYLGTYTFESLETYEAGRPKTYTRRIGDPYISYWNMQSALYLQDDIRVRKTLTLSPGVRVEAQTQVDDKVNIGPRFGVTWAPFKSGKTTLRFSAGMFYDWLPANTYEQTLRVDGKRQQELNIVDPPYPVTEGTGVIPPTNRYLLADDLEMAGSTRLSAGFEQQIKKAIRLGAVYSYVRGQGLLVGQNLNAPVNGVRPDPSLANIIEAVPAGESRAHSIQATMNLNFSPPAMAGVTSGPRVAWRRGLLSYATYTVGRVQNNTDGAFNVPASGSLGTEWGPASNDIRQRLSLVFYSQAIRNFTTVVAVFSSSGSPYTIRTGYDDNGDLMFNDRPAGVGRNSVRGASQWYTYASLSYVIGFGKRKVPLPPGVYVLPSGGGLNVGTMTGQEAPRYRLTLSLFVTNLTNHPNYTNYSGLMTSPFFMQPTVVEGVRRFDLMAAISF
jgi:hypothetical protein